MTTHAPRAQVQEILLTERLVLAPHDESDIPFMIALNTDSEVDRYVGDGPLDHALALTIIGRLQEQRAHGTGRLVVLERSTGERIGWCGLKRMADGEVDLGYRFLRRCWGRGFASEASRACLTHGFEVLGLPRIVAETDRRNVRSIRLLERLGFSRAGEKGDDTRWELVRPEMQAP
jgi:ribosomal-protein-alanine N-acetyltransferase